MANDCSDCRYWQRQTYDPDGDHLGRPQAEVETWGICLKALGPQHRIGYFDADYYVENDAADGQVVYIRSLGAQDEPPFFVDDWAHNKCWLITKETFSCSEHQVVV